MRWCGVFVVISLLALAGATIAGCGASQDEATLEPEPPPPPPPQARPEPRVWELERRYKVGWPIRVRVGLVNAGETVVNTPEGSTFGVQLRAKRLLEQPEIPIEAAPAEAPAEAETAPTAGSPEAAATSGETAQGDAGPAAAAGDAAAGDAAAAQAPPPPRFEDIECESLPVDAQARYLTPLATGSNTYRHITVDDLCPLRQPGRYYVEVVQVVPEVEGGDVSGETASVTLEFDLELPDPPIVARMTAQPEFTSGDAIETTLRVTNYGEEQVRLAGASQLQVQFRAQSQGEEVPCTEPARGRGRPTQLAAGENMETTVNLSERCQLTIAGRYTIIPSVVVPRSGTRSFNGTLEVAPFEIEIIAADTPAPAPSTDMVVDDPEAE